MISVFCLFSASQLCGQRNNSVSDGTTFVQTFGRPLFQFNTYTFKSNEPEKSQLHIYLAFVNDILQFVKQSDNLYKSKYEISIDIFDNEGNHQAGNIVTDEISVQRYEETNSRIIINQHHFVFELKAGSYDLILDISDLDTKRHLTRKRKLEIANFNQEKISISDLMFLNSGDMDSILSINMFPNISNTLETPLSEFSVYFELYTQSHDSVELSIHIYNEEKDTVYTNKNILISRPKVFKKLLPLKTIVHSIGFYYLTIEARTAGESVTKREGFLIQASNESSPGQTLPNSSATVKALKYIAKSSDYSEMMNVSSDERIQLVEQFWKKRDPTPDTQKNELKEEFFRRLDFCRRYFASPTENLAGWETDKGKIYLIYGPPSDVQRRNPGKDENPFEIWYYKHIDRRFVFIEKNGRGVYRLIHKD